MSDLSLNETRRIIRGLTGIIEDELRIRFITSEKGEIIQIVVNVDNEKTAEYIRGKVNQCTVEGRRGLIQTTLT